MAASMRLRLHFDGSVCTQISPRKCWFLVNVDNCNVVGDLEYLIRERFELDRGLSVNLYLDDFLLPSLEKIHVIRDNDTLWVKLIKIDDHFLQGDDEPPTPPIDLSSEEINLSHPEQKHEKRPKSKARKRKSCSPSHEASPSKRRGSKEKLVKLVGNLKERADAASGSALPTKEKNRQHGKKCTKEKKKDKVDHPNERPETSSPETSSQQTSSQQTSSQHHASANDVNKHGIGSTESSSRSRDQQKATDKALSSKKTPSSASSAKSNATKGHKGLTESRDKTAKKAKHDKKPANASDSSKVHQKPNSKTSTCSNLREDQDGSEQGASAAVISNVEIPNIVTHIANTQISSANQAGTGNLGTEQSSAQEGGRHSFARKKKFSTPVPVPLSSGHIRFESTSESESDLSSTSEDSVETNNERNNQQTNQEQTNKGKDSTNSQDETRVVTERPLVVNGTTDKSASTPSATCNHSPELPAPSNGQLRNLNNRQVQKNSSPLPQRTSATRGRGQAKGNGGNWDKKCQLEARQSNKSVIIQNSAQEPELPAKDFTSFPPLVGPPRQGDFIAYKILELSESYCPELSDYKEAKVLSVNTATGQLDVELTSVATKPSKPGKFDLQWEEQEDEDGPCNDGSNIDPMVCLQLQDLVEPRLVPPTST